MAKIILVWILVYLTNFCFGQDTFHTDSANVEKVKSEILKYSRDNQKLAFLYKELGKSYENLYGFNKYSIDSYQKGLRYYELLGDSTNYYDLKMNIGLMYYFDDYTKKYAIENYKEALRYYRKNNQIEKGIHCELSIIDAKKKVKPFDNNLIIQLLKIEQQCIKFDFRHLLGYARNLLTYCYIQSGNLAFARKYVSLSQEYALKAQVEWLVSLNYFFLAQVEDYSDNNFKAIDLYLRAYKICGKSKNVAYAKDICYKLSQCYSEIKDFKKSNAFYRQLLNYSNQYYESEQTKTIRLEELNNKFENLRLKNQLTEQENRQTNLQNILLYGLITFLVFAILALFIGRNQQKVIAKQNEIIHNQKIKNLELNALESLIQGQENERRRIARDLHDGLGIQLSQIKFFVEAHLKVFSAKEIRNINQIIDDACQEIRLISNNIHPAALSEFGLYTALEDLVNKLSAIKKTKITLEKYGNIPQQLSKETIALVYRAIQELMNNALKHASASKVNVQILANHENLLISVEDDGVGFDVKQNYEGSGIANISSRISYLNGSILWQNHLPDGKGTSVYITIPIVKR